MKAKIGKYWHYDNFQAGCAAKEGEKNDTVFFTFHDRDNEEIHMFEMAATSAEQFCNMVRQTVAGQKIELPSDSDVARIGRTK